MKVEWRPRAVEDREKFFNEQEQQSPKRAVELDTEFETKCNNLPQHPNLYGAGRVKGTREMEIRDSHIVVYRVQEKEQVIEIVRIQKTLRIKRQRQ